LPYFLFPVDGYHDFFETFNCCFQICDDIVGQDVRVGQIVKIRKAFIFKPCDIQAGFVAVYNLIISEFAPAAFGVFFGMPGFFLLNLKFM